MSGRAAADPIAFLQQQAPWLFAPELGVCIVGSAALRICCERTAIPGPEPGDLDLAWGVDPERGRALLEQHGVSLPTTTGNVARGTLALSLAGERIEITSFRGNPTGELLAARIAADLAERDMTIGGIAIELATGIAHDPHDGLGDWQGRRVVAIGDPAERIREHPIRWLRYYRKAHELDFELDRAVRRLEVRDDLLAQLPPEAVAGELRAILLRCRSPGRCLLELHEEAMLEGLSPELARQFDGRAAGPQRWHPEVSQALHLILALEWAAANTCELPERDRFAVLLAVLTHDLGKGWSPDRELPSHRGHEARGVEHVERLLARWPGFADARAGMLARHVCELHLVVRNFDEQRNGTLASHYERWFRPKDYPVRLFAFAVAADSAGRLGRADSGAAVLVEVEARLQWLRAVCSGVDAAALRTRYPDDLEAFRAALHEARARALQATPFRLTSAAAGDPPSPSRRP
ncbi:MAG: hypothetical protein KDE27_23780 [Planctomycetes bacterium]|nr:hypothetical protein [Planctomycetota bacterium]